MIFYARKIFRKLTGNLTFVIITDREDLDRQIYRNFLNTETVKKNEAAQPKNSQEMREFLSQNKRIVFTLIQKFRYDKGKSYPVLSDRNDIIVIVDEAHRTQYKSLAENMRAGLPNDNYLAFTGTSLLGKNRQTNAWFGDYVSEYNFSQSMDDGATVALFYLDKPMKDHTLMQTIARANRVSSHLINHVTKTNGEIIDYYNVFRNMKRALFDYALGDGELELLDLLKKAKMTVEETQKIKLSAQSLLSKLIANQPKVLVQDWYKDDQNQRRVKSIFEEVLAQNSPVTYDKLLFKEKLNRVFYLICNHTSTGQKWAV